MICPKCCNQSCEACESVSCTCGHDKSSVRPLTHRERQEYVGGRRPSFLLPAGSPYVAPAQPAVISIRTASNGSHG